MLRRTRVLALVAAAVITVALPSAAAPAGARLFRIGIVGADRGRAELDRLEPFRRRVQETLGIETRIERLPDVPRLVEAFAKGRIDLARLSSAAYVTAAASCGCVEPLAVPRAADGTAGFHAVVVARTGTPIRTAADLAGRRIAVGGSTSIVGGALAARLLAADLGSGRAEIETVAGPDAALAALVAGRVEAAMVWSSLTGDPLEGYGRGTLTRAVAEGRVSMSDIRVVWSSPELPHGPQVARSGLDEAKKRVLRDLFVDLAELDPDAYDAIEPTLSGGYLRIGDAAYRPYRKLIDGKAAATPAVSSGSGRRSSSTPAAADR